MTRASKLDAARSRPAQVRISGKNLGALALPDVCDRCSWLKIQMAHRLPYGGSFPGIFSTFDAIQKQLVHGHLDERRRPPAWLNAAGEVTDYRDPPHFSRFCIVDQTYNVLLTGAPDALLITPDGLVICDYKTAKFTGVQDELFPMYEVQLNVYATIAERLGMGVVSSLLLIYMEPRTPTTAACVRWMRRNGFNLPFIARVLPVQRRPEIIPPLLARVRELHDAPEPPPPRSGCKDCELMNKAIGLLEPAGGTTNLR